MKADASLWWLLKQLKEKGVEWENLEITDFEFYLHETAHLYDTNLKFIVFIFSEKLYLSYFYTLIWRNFHLQICPFALKNNILFQLHAAFEFNNFLPASCVFVAHLMTIIEITNSIRLSWCWGISYALNKFAVASLS